MMRRTLAIVDGPADCVACCRNRPKKPRVAGKPERFLAVRRVAAVLGPCLLAACGGPATNTGASAIPVGGRTIVQPSMRASDDERLHGAVVTGRFAPYVLDELQTLNVEPAGLLAALFPHGAPAPTDAGIHSFISARAHVTGSWTYFRSATVLVYEVAAAPSGGGPLVLYCRALPAQITENVFDAEWRVALVDPQRHNRVMSEATFRTSSGRHAAGDLDMIYADMTRRGNDVEVEITYARTGSGNNWEQTFEAALAVSGASLQLLSVRQTVGNSL